MEVDDPKRRKAANAKLTKEIGARLKSFRKVHYKSADQAFNALKSVGFSRGIESYKKYEKGERRIPADEAKLALTVFGAPDGAFEYLYSDDVEFKWGSQAGDENSPSILLLPRLTAREAAKMPGDFASISIIARKEKRVDPVPTRSKLKIGPQSFLYAIEDDSMIPSTPFEGRRFIPGDDVLIDPDVSPRPGDFVFAVVGSEARGIFRQWQESERDAADPETCFVLKPLNTNFRTENINPDTNPGHVVGCMIQHIIYRS